MQQHEKDFVEEIVYNEGFDYAFAAYSEFAVVKDHRFHELRKAFLKAREDLVSYVGLDV